jgi:hypothetical protein
MMRDGTPVVLQGGSPCGDNGEMRTAYQLLTASSDRERQISQTGLEQVRLAAVTSP